MRAYVLILCLSFLCVLPIWSVLAWTRVNPPIALSMWGVAGFNGQYVVVGGECTPNNWLSIGVSKDLVHWTSKDLDDIPTTPCPFFYGLKNWLIASDAKLGYVVFNGQSYLTSSDGNTWTWHNASTIGTPDFILCNGDGDCISYLQDTDGLYISHDLLSWSAAQASASSFSGYFSLVNGEIIGVQSMTAQFYSFNFTSQSFVLYMDLTQQMQPFQNILLFQMASGPNNTIILLGRFQNSYLNGIFVVTDMKNVECVAIFEGIPAGFYYQNGALLTYSSTGYNVTFDMGATWTTHACFSSTDNSLLQCTAKLVDGKFIVVGDNGLFVSSSDGKVWTTLPTIPGSIINIAQYSGVFYLFTYVGSDVDLYQSTDGATWTFQIQFTPPGSFDIGRPPVYIPSLKGWVVFFVDGNTYQMFPKLSSDFEHWNSLNLPCNETTVTNIVFGNGILMIVEYLNSTDSILWYQFANDTTGTWNSKLPPPTAPYATPWIAFGNGIFVIVNGNECLVTSDAISWAAYSIPPHCYTVSFVGAANGVFFCGNFWQPPTAVSKDGKVWQVLKYPTNTPTKSSNVLFDGKNYIISFVLESFMLISSDGYNWNQVASESYLGLDYSIFNGKIGILVGSNNNEIYVTK
eukprot:Phypoly_transcript_05108.p1 GENE.Phypoly_transcript_05108~~Phypoly_transcript_05108.p1  ORF type:complete len:630 (+),score=59.06 Phypoly_transcript_05108:114-2003(+)